MDNKQWGEKQGKRIESTNEKRGKRRSVLKSFEKKSLLKVVFEWTVQINETKPEGLEHRECGITW